MSNVLVDDRINCSMYHDDFVDVVYFSYFR